MSYTRSAEVAVIGAGAFGAWTAWSLRRTGRSVVLIDAWGPGHSRSSSGGESRIIRMGYGADEIRPALSQLPAEGTTEDHLRSALRELAAAR